MAKWFAPPGGQASSVNPTDAVLLDQSGITRTAPLGAILNSVLGIQGASNDDQQAQLFAAGYQMIVRLDVLGITTTQPPATTGAPGTTASPGALPYVESSTISFSDFTASGGATTTVSPGSLPQVVGSSILFTNFMAAPPQVVGSSILFTNFH